jgi:hypothetical protein
MALDAEPFLRNRIGRASTWEDDLEEFRCAPDLKMNAVVDVDEVRNLLVDFVPRYRG